MFTDNEHIVVMKSCQHNTHLNFRAQINVTSFNVSWNRPLRYSRNVHQRLERVCALSCVYISLHSGAGVHVYYIGTCTL